MEYLKTPVRRAHFSKNDLKVASSTLPKIHFDAAQIQKTIRDFDDLLFSDNPLDDTNFYFYGLKKLEDGIYSFNRKFYQEELKCLCH